MKKQKTMSLFCALAMALTLVLPVSAAHATPLSQLSTFAGTTMRIAVVSMDGNEMCTQDVNVAIPAGTTKAQQAHLVTEAASVAMALSTQNVRGGYDNISTGGSFHISSGWNWDIGGGKLAQTYLRTIVQISGITATSNATTLTVTITNGASPGAGQSKDFNISDYQGLVIFDRNAVSMTEGTTLSVVATTNRGGAILDSCTVWGDPYGV